VKVALQKGSFQDSPTGSSLVIWLPGCEVKCGYCFNHDIGQQAKTSTPDALKEIRSLRSINQNTGEPFHTYDWVIVSGGEPLLNVETVEQLLSEVRRVSNGDEVPIKTGIYTNGTKHEELKDLITAGLLDYVHIDFKLKPADLDKYSFSDAHKEAFVKTVRYVTKQYALKKFEYLKFSTVLTKQDHNCDYVVDMITEASKLFTVQPTYVLRGEDVTKDKFVWEFVDFFCGEETKILDPSYTIASSKWNEDDKRTLCKSLKIINSFKAVATEKPKREMVLHPDHYNHGKFEVIDILKDQLTQEEFKGWLRGNVLKYVMRAPYKEEEFQDYKKAEFYISTLMKSTKED
jgi:pyruvate-formate lyase-activating enzyme